MPNMLFYAEYQILSKKATKGQKKLANNTIRNCHRLKKMGE